MGRTFAIVVTAALVGGIAGAAIGIVLDGGRSSSSTVSAAPAGPDPQWPAPPRGAPTRGDLRADAPGVVVITDTAPGSSRPRSSARAGRSRSARSAPAS